MAVANAQAPVPQGDNVPQKAATGAQAQNPNANPSATLTEQDVSPKQVFDRFKGLNQKLQLQLIIGMSITIAIIVAVFVWTSQPEYKLLYGNLTEKAAGEITQVLDQQKIPYKLDEKTGEVLVPSDQVHSVRIALAAQGLPKQDGSGFELLDEKFGFGTSQFMENARYNRALEGELARSIKGIAQVESARVHVAIPKQSVFIRDRQDPTASVLVHLTQGKSLDEVQISSIVHLVASSIPNMKPENVTVVDQTGRLLAKRNGVGDMALSSAQYEYKKKLEADYIERLERILMPMVGFDGVRAQVDAEIDFSVSESSAESFNPDLPAVRSEQTVDEESRGADLGGVPGALTNQPPPAGIAPETLPAQAGAPGQAAQQPGQGANQNTQSANEPPSKRSKRATYNYELDRTVSHTRKSPGQLKRLSVAVVVDDKTVITGTGDVVRQPHTPEELDRITGLVKETLGFSVARGDSLNVINTSFQTSLTVPPAPELPWYKTDWAIDIYKQMVGLLAVIVIIMLVVRPVIKALTHKEPEPEAEEEELTEEQKKEMARMRPGGLSTDDWKALGVSQEEFEQMLQFVRDMVKNDPRMVAQVVKTWVAIEDESATKSTSGAGAGQPA